MPASACGGIAVGGGKGRQPRGLERRSPSQARAESVGAPAELEASRGGHQGRAGRRQGHEARLTVLGWSGGTAGREARWVRGGAHHGWSRASSTVRRSSGLRRSSPATRSWASSDTSDQYASQKRYAAPLMERTMACVCSCADPTPWQ